MSEDDAELLRRYVDEKSSDAFAALVRRHLGLVYHAALRQLYGDPHRAEEATQAVFCDLALKAPRLLNHSFLTGWLFTSTRYAAARLLRSERRRLARDQQAFLMDELLRTDDGVIDWERLRPVIDESLHALGERDRAAVLLRFFEALPFAEIAARMALSEDAARMRVERALVKLRAVLARRGVTSSAAALAAALSTQAGIAAPAGLATSVAGTALTGAATAGGGAFALATFFMLNKIPLAVTTTLTAAAIGGLALQQSANSAREDELARLRAGAGETSSLEANNRQLAATLAEAQQLRADDSGLAAAETEATQLKAQLESAALADRRATQTAKAVADSSKSTTPMDRAPQVLSRSKPTYPATLRTAGIESVVHVVFVVDATGTPQNITAAETNLKGADVQNAADGAATINGISADEAKNAFQAAAIEAVQNWKFNPGQKGSRLVNTRVEIPIEFSLSQSENSKNQGLTIFDENAKNSTWF